MRIYLIRHGKTAGNLQRRYIGCRTDEPLCDEGIRELRQSAVQFLSVEQKRSWTEKKKESLPEEQKQSRPERKTQKGCEEKQFPQKIIISPMLRCRQTAEYLFPGQPQLVEEDFRECDFGSFENRNYQELQGNAAYQDWIDSGGTLPFPGGEDPRDFRRRCREAFERTERMLEQEACFCAALVVHGGTIMSIMEAVAEPQGSYFDFQAANAQGYLLEGSRGRYCYHKWPLREEKQ